MIVQAALDYFKELRNPTTTWVHQPEALIPIYDNLLYVLALFESRQVAEMKEAKRLFEHILYFQIEGRFPTYVHNYPFVKWDERLLVPLYLINRTYYPCQEVIDQLLAACSDSPNTQLFKQIDQATDVTIDQLLFATLNPSLYQKLLEKIETPFVEGEKWERGQPLPSLQRIMLHYAMYGEVLAPCSELILIPKDVRIDPIEKKVVHLSNGSDERIDIEVGENHLTCYQGPFECEAHLVDGVIEATFTMTQPFDPQDCKNPLITFYFNHPEAKVWVNGARSMTFRSGEQVTIEGIQLSFEGSDRWMGQISRSNRPPELIRDKFSAFDLQIGLRSVHYEVGETVRVQLDVSSLIAESEGLSIASPMACMP